MATATTAPGRALAACRCRCHAARKGTTRGRGTRPLSLAAAFACATLGTCVAAFAAPALARPARFPIARPAKAKVLNRPDFKITKISVIGLPGSPGYMVLNPHGIAPGFKVKVTTKNVGHATKKTSETALIFTSGGRVYSLQLAKVPARGRAGLAHNGTYTSTFMVDSLSPPLGFTYISAEANSPDTVPERDRSNNELKWVNGRRPWVPVIPQEWTVAKLKATASLVPLPGAGQSVSTDVNPGFVMTFSRLDGASERFVYTPYGSVNTHATYSYPSAGCTGAGGFAALGSGAWAYSDGFMEVDLDLQDYEILLATSKLDQFHLSDVYCNGVNALSMQWTSIDFVTDANNLPAMSPSSYSLSDDVTVPSQVPGEKTEYAWQLDANVPKYTPR